MPTIPEPVWPACVLAVIQLADAVFCAVPMKFVTQCLDDVRLAPRYRPLLAPLKAAACIGVLAGLWIEYLGAVTAACLTLYFVLAVASHIRVADIGRNLVSACTLLLLSAFTLVTFL